MTWIFRLLIFIVYLLPVFFIPDKILGSVTSKYLLLNILSSIILLLFFFNFRSDKKIYFPRSNKFFLFFCIFFIFNLVFSVYRLKSLLYLFYILYAFILSIAIINILNNQKEKNIMFNHLFYSGIIPCVLSIFFKFYLFENINTSLVSTFGNQNWFAEYIVLIMFIFFYIRRNLFSSLTFILYIFCVFSTGSRAGIGIMLLGLIIIGIRRSKITWKRSIILILLLTAVSSFYLKDNISRISSINYRLYLIEKSVEYLQNNPSKIFTGVGIGNYKDVITEHQMNRFINKNYSKMDLAFHENISHAHNDFIEVFLETGIFFFIFIIYNIVLFYKNNVKRREYFFKCFYLFIGLFSIVSFPLRLPAVFFLFLIISSIVIDKKEFDMRYFSIKKKKFLIVLCFVFFFLFLLNIISYIIYYSSMSEKKVNISSLKLAYSLNPMNIEIYNSLVLNSVLSKNTDFDKELLFFGENIGFSSKRLAAIGIYYEKNHLFSKALYYYERAYKSAKRYKFPATRMEYILLKQNKFEKCAHFYEFAFLYENNPKYLFKKAELFYKIKKDRSEMEFLRFIKKTTKKEDLYKEYIKISYFRLYLLSNNKDYLKKAFDIKIKTIIDNDLVKEKLKTRGDN